MMRTGGSSMLSSQQALLWAARCYSMGFVKPGVSAAPAQLHPLAVMRHPNTAFVELATKKT